MRCYPHGLNYGDLYPLGQLSPSFRDYFSWLDVHTRTILRLPRFEQTTPEQSVSKVQLLGVCREPEARQTRLVEKLQTEEHVQLTAREDKIQPIE